MITLETTQKVPLTVWNDGTIRVKDTRLLIDLVVKAYKLGECPEKIFEMFPSNEYTIADIYSVISYYLSHKDKIETYLKKREEEALKIKEKIESPSDYKEKREELNRILSSKK